MPIACRMLEISWAERCASALRSSSESPPALPTPWVATRIAAMTKRTAAKAARAVGVAQRSSQAKAFLRFTGRTLPAMSSTRAGERTPVVPLEAGAGPDNPPCPACGEPLFGWLAEEDRLGAPVRRCESCGLGIVGESAGTEEALAALDRQIGRAHV